MCHKVWDPTTNKVHKVGHAHVEFDKFVGAGWWRGQNIGKLFEIEDVAEMKWPDLELEKSITTSDIGLGGGVCGDGATNLGDETWPSIDEAAPDGVGSPLPQL